MEQIIQYCGFKVGDEEFAIPVMDVQEVIRPMKVTPVPLAEDVVRGLINLRGQIVTCISLRKLFQKKSEQADQHMNIIVRGEDGLFALVVDEITDIVDVDKRAVEAVPETLSKHFKKFVTSIYKRKKDLVILVEVEKIVQFKNVG